MDGGSQLYCQRPLSGKSKLRYGSSISEVRNAAIISACVKLAWSGKYLHFASILSEGLWKADIAGQSPFYRTDGKGIADILGIARGQDIPCTRFVDASMCIHTLPIKQKIHLPRFDSPSKHPHNSRLHSWDSSWHRKTGKRRCKALLELYGPRCIERWA